MSTALTIPKLQMSTTEGTLAEWLVEDGDMVEAGQAIYAWKPTNPCRKSKRRSQAD